MSNAAVQRDEEAAMSGVADTLANTTHTAGTRNEAATTSQQASPPELDIVDFDGPNDPTHPLNWSTGRKTISIFIISMNALLS